MPSVHTHKTKWHKYIVANCPGISGTVPEFPGQSRISYLCPERVPKICFSPDCPGIALIVPKLSRNTTGVATPPTNYDLGIDY